MKCQRLSDFLSYDNIIQLEIWNCLSHVICLVYNGDVILHHPWSNIFVLSLHKIRNNWSWGSFQVLGGRLTSKEVPVDKNGKMYYWYIVISSSFRPIKVFFIQNSWNFYTALGFLNVQYLSILMIFNLTAAELFTSKVGIFSYVWCIT